MVARPQAVRIRGWLILLCLAVAAALAPTGARAQNLTYGELKFGVMKHDAAFLGGIEKGLSSGSRFFLEGKVGFIDAPDFQINAGWTFGH